MKTFASLLTRAGFCAVAVLSIVPLSVAQLVFVPDANLRAALNIWVPGAVDAGGYLDTGDPAVLAQISLALTVDWNPADLTGVDALDNLTELSIHGRCLLFPDSYPCDSNAISIPGWPVGLVSLELDRGTWSSLPSFPDGLNELSINVPGPGSIPEIPAGVTTLTLVDQSTLGGFPLIPYGIASLTLFSKGHPFPAMPNSIIWLSLDGNSTMPIPPLPDSIETLFLANFTGSSISFWPVTAQEAHITHMPQLVYIAPLPTGLKVLGVSSCVSLFNLPTYPSGLEQLYLVDLYALDSLPPWPSAIQQITLGQLPVVQLPPLPPSLIFLGIYYLSELTCLPLLPDSLAYLNIDNDWVPLPPTPLTCLPNIPPGLVQYEVPYLSPIHDLDNPDILCSALNSSCDFLNPAAVGTVYWDGNANSMKESGEPGYPYATLHQPDGAMHGVAADGTYAWPMPIGDYILSATSDNPYVLGISPAERALSFTLNGEVSTGNDFGVVLQPDVQDLRIDLTGPMGQPGFDHPGTITCENVGTVPMDATVTFQLDADQSWVGATPAPTSVVGNTITWYLLALQVGETRPIALTAHTDAGIAIGTSLVQTVELGPVLSDATPTDNVGTYTTEVVGSYDPNDKSVQPSNLSPAEVATGNNELAYTIRFQNCGTWPAVKVMVVDTLSPDLQWSSFRKISSSHPCTWELDASGVLSFLFDPINLPDSTNDEPNSHGFVKFAIKPMTTLPLGATIANTAAIHFDFNAPVITLPALFTVAEPTGIPERMNAALVIYPNPVIDVLWVTTGLVGEATVKVFDAMGRELISRTIHAQPRMALPVGALPSGSYAVRITSASGFRSAHFVKQ